MYIMTLDSISEKYDDLDQAMHDCFNIFPNASFSEWQETATETWMDIINNDIVVGKIFEVPT